MSKPVQLMFTVSEAAEEFGTTEKTIEEGISLGLIFVNVVRNRRLIARSEIEHLWHQLERRGLV